MTDLTEKQIAERFADGRGAGDLAGYKPFIDVHDLSSDGLVSRVPSLKTGRIQHFLSQIESVAFLEFIRMPEVVDVKEQFPLDREDTRSIAAEMGVEHPRYRTGVDLVMTTDLLVVVGRGRDQIRFARAGKPIVKLLEKRVLEILEIERRYWERRDVHWGLVTDLDRTDDCAVMHQWLHGMEVLPESPVPHYWDDRINAFRTQFAKARDITFEDFDRRLSRHGFQRGEMLNVFRHLCWHRELVFDLNDRFDMQWPVSRVRTVKGARRGAAS